MVLECMAIIHICRCISVRTKITMIKIKSICVSIRLEQECIFATDYVSAYPGEEFVWWCFNEQCCILGELF